jgi:tetratricopeptide (TPR) repeat protein
MRRTLLILAILTAAVSSARGDGILLADGRKLSGRVTEKPDGYEVTVEGQTVGFSKTDVKQWFKSPKEVLGDADKQVEEAKKLYSEAVVMADEKAAEAKFREALPKVQKAREAYVEAREFFPEGYPAIDDQLVNVMKLMRLVRERFHSQIASGESSAPVKVKEAPAPKMTAKVEPPPPTPSTAPETAPASSLHDALLVLVDPAKRNDAAQRASAAKVFRKGSDAPGALADVATAGWLFLSKSDFEWGLSADTVVAKGPNGETTYKGHLDKRSDSISVLILADHREVRIRTAPDGKFVTPPGSAEFKAADLKVLADQKTESLESLQAFFKGLDAAKLEALDDKDVSEGVKFLALKVKDLKTKNQPVDALSLFVAGPASALIEKDKGKPTADIEAAFKDLGFEKSEFGSVWGRKEGIAMDDYRKWLVSGEYGMAIIQFNNDYRALPDQGVRYAMGLLQLFRALGENRNYQRAAASFDQAASGAVTPAAKDHFMALAKSIRDESPCNVCGGTHKVNCSACKGNKKINAECTKCGGSGKVSSFNGIVVCTGCQGKGRYNNIDCPKCKATGKTECKGRGCAREVQKPTFETFAEAYRCPVCQGRGSLMRHVALPCIECSGIGLILQPKSDPSKLLK